VRRAISCARRAARYDCNHNPKKKAPPASGASRQQAADEQHCLEAAFRFLLDREPKESILARFDVTAISRYFPEFEGEMPRYLLQF
jgi:hypothetical protein